MARPRKDITGKRYGMLRAISPTGEVDKSGNAYWNCECDCGNTIVVSLRNLRNKQTKSCGCLETINGKKLGAITRNHCVDGSDPYKLYGDKPRKNNKSGYRGVSLNKRTNRYAADITFKGKRHHLGEFDTAEEAHDAYLKAKEELHEPYLKDFLHSNPEEKSKVERIGVIKKPRGTLVYYTPENRYISILELSEITGVSRVNLYSRLNKGYTGEELWSTKRLTGKGKCTICVDYYGDQVTIPELSSITGISDATLRYRYDKGYRGEELWTGKIQHYQRKKAISQKAKIYVEYDGEKVSLYELSKKIGIDYGFLWKRYSKGVRGSQLFQESMKKEILVDYEGEKINLKELSSRTGIGYTTLHRRYRSGDCGKELWRNLQSEKEIDYQGKIVTLNELSKITKIAYNTLLYRYSNGDRSEDLWRPVGQRKKNKKK